MQNVFYENYLVHVYALYSLCVVHFTIIIIHNPKYINTKDDCYYCYHPLLFTQTYLSIILIWYQSLPYVLSQNEFYK